VGEMTGLRDEGNVGDVEGRLLFYCTFSPCPLQLTRVLLFSANFCLFFQTIIPDPRII
jgi:hypothetical protein